MNARLLVVGALHWDVIVDAPRLPRLDETLFGDRVTYRLGGKGGNQAIAAAEAGASVSFAGRVGSDAPGDAMRAKLQDAGVDVTQLQKGEGASGMSVAIVESQGDYGAVVVSAENFKIEPQYIDISSDNEIILCQNELPVRVLERAAEITKARSLQFWLNLAPAGELPDSVLDAVSVLIVNRLEAADLLSVEGSELGPEDLATRLSDRHPNAVIIVTLGADGVVITQPGQPPLHYTARRIEAARSHGAGDRFVGTLAAARLEGKDWPSAIAFAQDKTADFLASQSRQAQA